MSSYLTLPWIMYYLDVGTWVMALWCLLRSPRWLIHWIRSLTMYDLILAAFWLIVLTLGFILGKHQ